jgi:ATP-dependent DNA ligase
VPNPSAAPVGPMLAAATDRLPTAKALPGGCWFEPKWDGYRCLVSVSSAPRGGAVATVWSRRGHDITRAFPDIAEAARRMLLPGCTVDGELLVWAEGRLDFGALQRRLAAGRNAHALAAGRPANLMAFDLLADPDGSLLTSPLHERRAALERAFADASPPLQLTPYTTETAEARAWLQQYAETRVGIEGLVIKGAGSTYEPGRRGWLKLRLRDTHEVVVGAVTGTLSVPQRLVVGYYDTDGELVVAGSTRALTRVQADQVVPLLSPPAQEHPWPDEIGSGRLGHWGGGPQKVTLVAPDLVVEIAADAAIDRGRWRHLTRFVRARPDLSPAEAAVATR